jgi:hypothetical protein
MIEQGNENRSFVDVENGVNWVQGLDLAVRKAEGCGSVFQ